MFTLLSTLLRDFLKHSTSPKLHFLTHSETVSSNGSIAVTAGMTDLTSVLSPGGSMLLRFDYLAVFCFTEYAPPDSFFSSNLGQSVLQQCWEWRVPGSMQGGFQLWVMQTPSFSWGSWCESWGDTDLEGSHPVFRIWHLMTSHQGGMVDTTSGFPPSILSHFPLYQRPGPHGKTTFLSLPCSKVWPRVPGSGHWDLSSGMWGFPKGCLPTAWNVDMIFGASAALWDHEVTLRIETTSMVKLMDRRSQGPWG